jgi:hypothetical protein
VGEPQSRCGHGGEQKNSQPPPGIEPWNPDRPHLSLVAIPTELSRFLFVNTATELYWGSSSGLEVLYHGGSVAYNAGRSFIMTHGFYRFYDMRSDG